MTSVAELAELYRESCAKHRSRPIEAIIQHLNSLDEVNATDRRPLLSLREHRLSAASCEALEEVLKRVSQTVSLFYFNMCFTTIVFNRLF